MMEDCSRGGHRERKNPWQGMIEEGVRVSQQNPAEHELLATQRENISSNE
jgi:hypothetical protein